MTSSEDQVRGAPQPRVQFFFVGPGKTGTSWIYEFIKRRDLATVPLLKEPHIVDMAPNEAQRAIEGLYDRATRLCDFSNTYSNDPDNPEKIYAHNPDARIVVTTRYPSRRVSSHYAFEVRSGLRDVGIETYLDEDPVGMVRRSEYRRILAGYAGRFPRHQILVLPLELLERTPEEYVRALGEFLECGPVKFTDEDRRPVLVRSRPRNRLVASVAKQSAVTLRRLGLARTLGRLKSSQLLSRALFSPVAPTSDLQAFGRHATMMSDLDRDYEEFLRDDIGIDLGSA